MAIIDVNYYSKALGRQVSYKAIIPSNQSLYPGVVEKSCEVKQFRSLYLLHGIMGNCNDWIINTRVAQFAEQHDIAIFMPSGDNYFYVDQEASNSYYGKFIGEELVNETRKVFNVSHKREDTFIGGLSMGGYGALRNGLKYSETFSAIVAMSSALIIDLAINSDEEAPWEFNKRSYFQYVFGDLEKLSGSDKDLEALVRNNKVQNKLMPKIYICCGEEDFLIENNREFKKFLEFENIEFTYIESEGVHDWKFWDEYIEKALLWLK